MEHNATRRRVFATVQMYFGDWRNLPGNTQETL